VDQQPTELHKHSRRDATGAPLHVGDVVRIVAVPDLAGMSPEVREATERVFTYLVGKYKRIAEFDDRNEAGIWFRIRRGPDAGIHWVSIEPFLLRLRRPRAGVRGESETPSNPVIAPMWPRARRAR
jgi:hypothetical protein